MSEMQVHITRHFSENRGDHAADAVIAHSYDPAETVEDMVCRVMGLPVSKWQSPPDPTDFVTIRVVAGTEPKEAVSDDNEPPF
jgi:hypothetical protein